MRSAFTVASRTLLSFFMTPVPVHGSEEMLNIQEYNAAAMRTVLSSKTDSKRLHEPVCDTFASSATLLPVEAHPKTL